MRAEEFVMRIVEGNFGGKEMTDRFCHFPSVLR